MGEEYLKGIINRIGMVIFIEYYYEFKKTNEDLLTNKEVVELIEENYTEKSKNSRTSKAKRIFREGLELEALEMIINADKIDYKVKNKAREILTKEK